MKRKGWIKVATFIFLFFLIGFSYAKDDGIVDYEFNGCPPPSAFDLNIEGDCDPKNVKCPYPMELYQGLNEDTGTFICAYRENGAILKECTYRILSCVYGNKLSISEDAISKKVNELNPLAGFSLSRVLAGLVTFNDDIVKVIVQKVGESEESNIYRFFVDFFRGIHQNLVSLSTIFFMIGTIYIFGVAGYFRFLQSIGEQVNTIPVKDTVFRIFASLFIFFFPLQSSSLNENGGQNNVIYYPLVWKAIQLSVDMGNKLADDVSDIAGGAFIRYIFIENKVKIQNMIDLLEERFEKVKERYETNKKFWDNCLDIYDIERKFKHNGKTYSIVLDIDKVTCKNIHLKEDAFSKGKWIFDCTYCSEVQNSLENDAKEYYSLSSFINFAKRAISKQYVSGNELRLTQITIPSSNNTDIIYPFANFVAQEKDLQKSLGWVNLFGTIGPITATYPVMIGGQGLEEKSILNDIQKKKDEGAIEKVAGFIGNIAYLAIPPGSTIYSFLDKVKEGVIDSTAGAFNKLVSSIPFFGNFVTFGSDFLLRFAGSVITIAIAIKITTYVLAILPLIVFTVAGSLKLVFYLIEVLKLVLVSPFVFVWSMTIQNKQNVTLFFSKIIKASLTPLLIVLSAITALFAYRLIFILSADLPAYLYTYIIETYKTIGLGAFKVFSLQMVFGIMKSILFVLASLGSSFMVFKLIMNGDEMMMELFGQIQGISSQNIRGLAESISERKARVINPI